LARPAVPTAFRDTPASTVPTRRVARLLQWTSRPAGAIVVATLLLVAGGLLAYVPGIRNADLALLDARFALLARVAPLPAPDSIAIVGIDEPSLATLDEPLGLALRPLAEAITAVASARPRAIGLDVVLPDRSYESMTPGAERALVAALIAARRVAPVVAGITTRDDGRVREIVPALLAAAGASGLTLLPVDEDGRVRRFDDRLGERGETVPTLAGEIARLSGVPVERGTLQYALGDGYDYVPLRRLIDWGRNGATRELESAFARKIVLFGAVLPFEDRFAQPVPLARWDRVRDVPGVLVHAQALRTLEAGAIVRPSPWPVGALLLVAAVGLWFVPGWPRRIGALCAFIAITFVASVWLLRAGIELPLGASLRVAITATALRSALEAWQARVERARLRTQFGGYVSPAVLRAILDGRLDDDARRGRRTLAFLFADIRGFVELSASRTPEAVLTLLNRYYSAMTPVLHAHGGTIDNFRGDGVIADLRRAEPPREARAPRGAGRSRHAAPAGRAQWRAGPRRGAADRDRRVDRLLRCGRRQRRVARPVQLHGARRRCQRRSASAGSREEQRLSGGRHRRARRRRRRGARLDAARPLPDPRLRRARGARLAAGEVNIPHQTSRGLAPRHRMDALVLASTGDPTSPAAHPSQRARKTKEMP
jgi:adenylate cyclase